MANRRKLAFIAASIAICWIAWGALVGIFVVLAHFLKSTTAVITVMLAVFYSCLFGLLGWQVYAWKGRRDGWPRASARERRPGRTLGTRKKGVDNAEDAESGWKRPELRKGTRRE